MKPIEASAPSNIAIIKYMGKTKGQVNLPSNASLSFTLEHLRSFVVIEPNDLGRDEWRPLQGFQKIELSEKGLFKFLHHFDRLKTQWQIAGHYTVYSANNFPADCGLASSASSFAALTKATALLAERNNPKMKIEISEMSRLSRSGSGSSCRSFFAPWSIWRSEGGEGAHIDLALDHAVILVEEGRKEVSSSDAHVRVTTSRLFEGRKRRAEERLDQFVKALQDNAWKDAYEICWAEFWDMHALFETSTPHFGYMQPGTIEVLNHLREIWNRTGDGPLVTMDAGANVHVLLRQDQRAAAKEWLKPFKTIASWSLS